MLVIEGGVRQANLPGRQDDARTSAMQTHIFRRRT
jgi:hypothetical protein